MPLKIQSDGYMTRRPSLNQITTFPKTKKSPQSPNEVCGDLPSGTEFSFLPGERIGCQQSAEDNLAVFLHLNPKNPLLDSPVRGFAEDILKAACRVRISS